MPNERAVTLAVKIYQGLLFLYPEEFRCEYGSLMVQACRDLCRETYAQARLLGLIELWGRILKDLIISVLEEQLDSSWPFVRQSVRPSSAWAVLLAILPGLIVMGSKLGVHFQHLCLELKLNLTVCTRFQPVAGLVESLLGPAGSSPWFYATLLSLILVLGGLLVERRPAVWSLTAVGVLLTSLPDVLLAWHYNSQGGSSPPGHAFLVNWLWPGLMWIVIIAVVGYRRSDLHLPVSIWALLALSIIINPFVFLLPGTMLLLAIVLSLLLARRDGLLAGLLIVASEFWIVDSIFDPGYGMLIWSYNYPAELIVSILPALFLLVVAPILVLRARSTGGRLGGLVLPGLVCLVAGEIIHSAVVRGTAGVYSPGTWLVRGTGIIQYLMAVVLFSYAHVVKERKLARGTNELIHT